MKSTNSTACRPARLRAIVAGIMLGALFSCASGTRREEPAPVAEQAATPNAAPQQEGGAPVEGARAANGREEIIERGTDSFIGASRVPGAPGGPAGDINLQFDNTDIKEFSQVVLGDML